MLPRELLSPGVGEKEVLLLASSAAGTGEV